MIFLSIPMRNLREPTSIPNSGSWDLTQLSQRKQKKQKDKLSQSQFQKKKIKASFCNAQLALYVSCAQRVGKSIIIQNFEYIFPVSWKTCFKKNINTLYLTSICLVKTKHLHSTSIRGNLTKTVFACHIILNITGSSTMFLTTLGHKFNTKTTPTHGVLGVGNFLHKVEYYSF